MRARGVRAPSLAGLVALAMSVLLGSGCSSRRARIEPVPVPPCREAFYRGMYEGAPPPGSSGPHEERRSFRASVRRCDGRTLLIELRGAIGGAQLVAGIRGEEVRLVIGRERLVVDGPDDPTLWDRWTGVPITGQMLSAALTPESGGSAAREVGGWAVRVRAPAAGGSFPAGAEAAGPGGERLTLELQSERATSAGTAWPAIPKGFRLEADPGSGTPAGQER